MTDEAFEILSAKMLTGEATPEERPQLDALLARDEQARREKSGEIAGHLLASQGQPEVMRGGKPITVNSVTALQPGDEIHLSEGVTATVITPAGSLPLKGPQRLAAEKLNGLAQSHRGG